MEQVKICEKCMYWIETGGTDDGMVGECRRNAPLPALIDSSSTSNVHYAVWPVTADRDWCGRFEERPMANTEVLARVAMIEKAEAERKAKMK